MEGQRLNQTRIVPDGVIILLYNYYDNYNIVHPYNALCCSDLLITNIDYVLFTATYIFNLACVTPLHIIDMLFEVY